MPSSAARGSFALKLLLLVGLTTAVFSQVSSVVNGAENSCFETASKPGCSDTACQEYICKNHDAFCCAKRWDDTCVQGAVRKKDVCQVGWPDQSNDCFQIDPFGRPGCDNNNTQGSGNYDHALCESQVCTLRPECCTSSYDEKCVELALKHCVLPEPKNACLSTSRLPRCKDEFSNGKCLESVCEKDETCCSVAYGSQCVALARNNTMMCAPKIAPNQCNEVSLFGGCDDRRCQNMVCTSIWDSCCDNQEQIGKWDGKCIEAADILCNPPIEDLPSSGGECPNGMTCSYDSMANCTELASQYRDVFYLGNILGGTYCGHTEGRISKGIINCPRGSYCPNPETMLPCPAGYYCPFKTQQPTIRCRRCQEGSLQLEFDLYGWIVLITIAALSVAYIGWTISNRYNKRLANHINDLERRVQKRITRASERATMHKKRELEKFRPKFELISYRLAKMENNQPSRRSIGSRESVPSKGLKFESDQIEFDADRLFDVLDTDSSDDLTYDQLNVILGLSALELQEFVRRMNEMAGLSESMLSVTRQVFAKYFLQVLTETCNFNISYEEAEAMFDELTNGVESLNEVHFNSFYASSMSDFLSDRQIFQLIGEFKRLKAGANDDNGMEKETSSFFFDNQGSSLVFGNSNRITSRRGSLRDIRANRRGSLQDLRSNRRGSFKADGVDDLRGIGRKRSFVATKEPSIQFGGKQMMIERDFFVQNYPQLLMDVMLNKDEETDESGQAIECRGVDLCFKDLSLSVEIGKKKVDVVDRVSGRIRGKTMTALMGGSGAGKTSLLNALCGRAHYGETTGEIYLNGHKIDLQKHIDCIGFVPQDDIVYPELTVRENFLFAGKFRLPKGTTDAEIEDLADETIANLGLSRVANSRVGDIKKRGISGGEKKRVNIGIELMALPSILFLDEPTSGLDASSALLVMQSLNHLMQNDAVTVVSVIHQPRKFIFDLFDSLILLGVGGKLIYHGPTLGAEPYFTALKYQLPKGESVADWLIDISSGRLEHDNTNSLEVAKEEIDYTEDNKSCLQRMSGELRSSTFKLSAQAFASASVITNDNHRVGKAGVTTGKVVQAMEVAKARRAWLCRAWLIHFNNLNDKEKTIYEPPEKYELPMETEKHTFWYQLSSQLNRALLVAWRNRFSKIVNCTIIVGSIIFITALDGVTKVSMDRDPNLPFATLVRPQEAEFPDIFSDLFAYSQSGQLQYAMKVGIMLCVLVGLSATSTLTSKRQEFFREAGSGYDLNAYFFAVNILSTTENSIQVLLAATFATWIRHPIASYASYYIHFLLLTWITVGWSMLFPMFCSPDMVILIAGFFFTFCGLIFSGGFPPFGYKEIYEEAGMKEFLAGWISPTRFFFEGLTVGELRCMPEQSGYTIKLDSYNRRSNDTMISLMGFAGHDLNAVRWSCNGWYWSVVPVLLIGITVRYLAIGAMHACFRAQQAKKPLIYVARRNRSVALTTLLYFIGLAVLVSVTTWLFIRDQPFVENGISHIQLLDKYGLFD